MIYTRARWADEAHTQVIGWDVEENSETVPANHELFRQLKDGPVGFTRKKSEGGVGGTIAPYEPPPALDPLTQPINRVQFEFMIDKLGIGPAIQQAIAAMPDGDNKIMAGVLFRSGQEFFRSHALFTQLAPAIGMTNKQIDDAWTAAYNLKW